MDGVTGRNRWRNRTAAFLLAALVLLFINPYAGIRHDATLYLGQALLVHDPENFSRDLFFRFGSQADFTVFPRLLALLLDRFSPGDVFLLGTLLGRIAFALCSWALIHACVPPHLRFVSLLAVLAMPSGYGGYGIFKYGESFLTARPFAEALTLLALAALVRRRHLTAAALIVLAVVLHPLQALPGLLIGWVYLVCSDRRWLHAAWAILPLSALAVLGISPFAMLARPFDPEWLRTVAEMNEHCFMLKWPARDWLFWLADLYLLSRIALGRGTILPRLGQATLIATVLASLASLILVDGLHLVFPTGLQLWRVHWLGHWLAMAGVPFLLVSDYRRDAFAPVRSMLLVALILVGAPTGLGAVPWAVIPLVGLHAAWPRVAPLVSAGARRLVAATAVLAIAAQFGRFLYFQLRLFAQHGYRLDLYHIEIIVLSHPLVVGLALCGSVLLWQRRQRWHVILLPVLAAACILVALRWDTRSNWSRNVEAGTLDASLFGVAIEPGAQVYWSDNLLATWLKLGRASYFNSIQQAGQLFNRGTAIEATRRQQRIAPLEFQAEICDLVNRSGAARSCFINALAMQQACAPRRDTPPPDYLVLPFRQPERAIGEWVIHDATRTEDTAHYFLYRCSDVVGHATPMSGKHQ